MTAVDWIQFALVIVKGDCLMIKHQCEEQESPNLLRELLPTFFSNKLKCFEGIVCC